MWKELSMRKHQSHFFINLINLALIQCSFTTACNDDFIGTSRGSGSNTSEELMKGGQEVSVGGQEGGTEIAGTAIIEGAGTISVSIDFGQAGDEAGSLAGDTAGDTAGEPDGGTFIENAGSMVGPLAGEETEICPNPRADTSCDGIDDDCDGRFDEEYSPPRGVWSDCGNFDDPCDEMGSQTSLQTRCVDGALVQNMVSQVCERDTDRVVVSQGVSTGCLSDQPCSLVGIDSRTDTICRDGAPVSVRVNAACMRESDGEVCRTGMCVNGMCAPMVTVTLQNTGTSNSAARLSGRCAMTGSSCIAEGNRILHENPSCSFECPNHSPVELCCSNGDEGCGGTPENPLLGLSIDQLNLSGFETLDCPVIDGQRVDCQSIINTTSLMATVDCSFLNR